MGGGSYASLLDVTTYELSCEVLFIVPSAQGVGRPGGTEYSLI